MSEQETTPTLSGQVAVVTGGSQGIGLATVTALAAAGMTVAAVSRDRARLDRALASFGGEMSERVTGIAADVSSESDVNAAVNSIVSNFGQVDVLVNSAGTSMRAKRPFAETATDEWRRLIDTNLTGTYLMCRSVLAHMQVSGSGYIVNVLSTAAYRSQAGVGAYAASKFGARAVTESMMDEYRGTGIRITSVSPGPVNTTIWDHKLDPPTAAERELMLAPSDVADIIRWLLERPTGLHIPDITVTPWRSQ